MQAEDIAQEAPQDNLERLATHLKKDSLAERLVRARTGAGADARATPRKVMMDRIEELKRAHDLPDH